MPYLLVSGRETWIALRRPPALVVVIGPNERTGQGNSPWSSDGLLQ